MKPRSAIDALHVKGCTTTKTARARAKRLGYTEWLTPLGWAPLDCYVPIRRFTECGVDEAPYPLIWAVEARGRLLNWDIRRGSRPGERPE